MFGLELFKIVENDYIPNDTIVVVSPITYQEARECENIDKLLTLLLSKKKIIIGRNTEKIANEKHSPKG